jgi:hypothetical protein
MRARLSALEKMLDKGIIFKIPYWRSHHPTHYYHGQYQIHPVTRLCQPFHQCSDGTAKTGIFLSVSDAAKEILQLVRDNSDMSIEEVYNTFLTLGQKGTPMSRMDLWWPEPFPLPMSREFMTPLDHFCCEAEKDRVMMRQEARQREIEYLEDLQSLLQMWQKARRQKQAWDDDVDLEVPYPSFF